MCTFSVVEEHENFQCFKKNPDKAPKYLREKNSQAVSASSSIEVVLTSLCDHMKVGVDLTVLPAKKVTLAEFHQEDVWICDTSTSTHMSWSNMCMRNIHNRWMLNLWHTSGTIELQQ